MDSVTQLADSEALYRLIAENTNELVIVQNATGHVVYANRAAAGLLADSQRLANDCPAFGELHPEDELTRQRDWTRALAGETTVSAYRVRKQGGCEPWRWLEASTRLIRYRGAPHVLTQCREMPSQRGPEKELQIPRDRPQSMVDTGSLILFALDSNGVFTISEGAERRFSGPEPTQLLGRSIFDICRDNPSLLADVRRALAGESFATPADPNNFVPETHWKPTHDDAGAVNGAIGMSMSITQRGEWTLSEISERKKDDALRNGQNIVLEMIATNAPLTEVLETLTLFIESQSPGALCSVLILEEDGLHVRHGSSPSLPIEYVEAINGAEIGPTAGSCGTAMFTAQPVIVTDILVDPLWDAWRDVASAFGLRACWSTPLRAHTGQVLGSFAIYYREPRSPSSAETSLVKVASRLASIAIEKTQAEERLRSSLQEKEVLLKEIHHRVKNNLQMICSMLSLQAQQLTDAEATDAFMESQNRVRAIALAHELLYRSTDFARVHLAPHLESLCAHLYRSFNVDPNRITLGLEVLDVMLGLDQAVPCSLIVSELVSNALKHAFPDGQPGRITVRLSRQNNGRYLLEVADNGVGLPKQRRTDTLGLQLVEDLAEQLRGCVKFDTHQGTTFSIEFAGAP